MLTRRSPDGKHQPGVSPSVLTSYAAALLYALRIASRTISKPTKFIKSLILSPSFWTLLYKIHLYLLKPNGSVFFQVERNRLSRVVAFPIFCWPIQLYRRTLKTRTLFFLRKDADRGLWVNPEEGARHANDEGNYPHAGQGGS
jgi:hypothetical protein